LAANTSERRSSDVVSTVIAAGTLHKLSLTPQAKTGVADRGLSPGECILLA
jgi:hypothetical protein